MLDAEKEWLWSKDTLRAIFSRIAERKELLLKESVKSELNSGVDLGLFMALDMIKNDIESRGYDFEEFMKGDDKES